MTGASCFHSFYLAFDVVTSPAEMLYGTQLRVPGEFFSQSELRESQTDFLKKLEQAMSELRTSKPAWHSNANPYIDADLQKCKFVFVRTDRVRLSFEAPFEGPYEVDQRCKKYFVVKKGRNKENISIDRLKPPREFPEDMMKTDGKQNNPTQTQKGRNEESENVAENNKPPVQTTRSGRRVKIPSFYY
ncbi:uncharacterized protein [Musca autumnalis]|uniref:uncharacterized protein n=1 Tax=Musca autumnalis TaxID=221902 RepID=UPI003CEC967E